ncbi:DUF4232 domain-containing protein [Streptomyces sp. NPDC032940]|uniref:DUF4232 domain-containing protein n=1 Tax=Streptomyces sp. NPDC032940 TaxID=3155366 RepID=UPI0033F00B24
MNTTMRQRSALLAAAGTALVLSLTACQGDEDAGTSSAPSAEATVASSPTASGTPAGKGTGTPGATGAGDPAGSSKPNGSAGSADDSAGGTGGSGGSGEQAGASAPLCKAGDVKVTADTQDGPPYTHIVLTARNSSGHSCRMTGFPHVQFLESHKQDAPAVAKSKPGGPIVLGAGDPAYALVKLSDGGMDEENEPVVAFSVTLEGDPTVIAVSAPGSEGIAVDPAKALTGYWTYELRNGADDF